MKTATLEISIGTLFEALQLPSFNMIVKKVSLDRKDKGIIKLKIKGFDERLNVNYENNLYKKIGCDELLEYIYSYDDEGDDYEEVEE